MVQVVGREKQCDDRGTSLSSPAAGACVRGCLAGRVGEHLEDISLTVKGKWSEEDKTSHINLLEFKATWLVSKHFELQLEGLSVLTTQQWWST